MFNKILVTGGNGFIGCNFISHMFKTYNEIKIINIDKLTYAANTERLDFLNNKNYTHVLSDISNVENFYDLDFDCIIHFAAESHVDRSIENSEDFIKTNINGTLSLLELAKNRNIKFHHISTDEVFGSIETGSFNEESKYAPLNPYSASKAASDHLVRAYHNTYGLPVNITNCSNNYGPFQNVEKFIPNSIKSLLSGSKIKLYGDGLNVRDWLYVEDHCKAIDLVLNKGKNGETYCVGGNKELTNLDVAKQICSIMKIEDGIEFIEDRKGHDRRYSIDFQKINRELGWMPSMDFLTGLKRTIKWYSCGTSCME